MRPFHYCRCSPSVKKAGQSGFSRFLSTSSKVKSTARAAQSLIQPVRGNVNQSKAGRGTAFYGNLVNALPTVIITETN